jgi:SAM domain (Sterile alpha motif)
MERWRASQVLAWLEVALGMPQYSSRCSENVKSGKVLLELSDAELENGLGATHPMHRKKLRLAIEEQRRPDLIRYPTIGQLGHTWVSKPEMFSHTYFNIIREPVITFDDLSDCMNFRIFFLVFHILWNKCAGKFYRFISLFLFTMVLHT